MLMKNQIRWQGYIYNKIMRIKRSQTEAVPDLVHHREHNSRIKRTNSSILNHQLLRLQVIDKQEIIKNIFNKNQKQLCDYFIKYVPLSYSNINVKKIVDEKIDEVRLIKNSNKIYFGGIHGDTRHGEGVLIDDKGKIYEGCFDNNNKSGHGVEIYPNGNVYIGNFEKNKKHGKGQFYWFSLSPPVKEDALYVQYYDGRWWGGLPDGTGSHQKSTGDIYDGEFKNGLKHGKGEEYFFNGDSYQGQYVNGLPQGFGIYFWNDGSKYEGEFKQGLRSGNGYWISSDGKQEYKGGYLMDKKNGYGQYSWLDKVFLYKGNFENDIRQGYGQLFKNGQQEYKGEWVAGKIKQQPPQKNMNDVSARENSILKTPKSSKFPSLTKLKPPASAIIQRIRQTELLQHNRSLQRSKSPKSSSKSLNKLKNTLGLSKSKKKLPLQKTLKKRPISVYNRPTAHFNVPKYQLLVRKCNKKNCGCNVSIPLNLKGGKKVHHHIKTQTHGHGP